MEVAGVIERVERIAGVRATAAADAAMVQSGLVAVREARAWLDAQHAGLVAQLGAVSSFPEAAVAEADRVSIGAASKTTERSGTLASTPRLAGSLADGAVTAGHVDAVTRGCKQLDAGQRGELFDRVESLVAVAEAATVEQFAKRVALEVKRIQSDDGVDRLERQRRATRLSSWVDAEGMWNLRGRFDPLTGVRLDAKLRDTLEAVFAESEPDGCPDDPIEKQQFLAAHALARLLDGAGGNARPGRGEFVVVIDADADPAMFGPGPVADWSIPVEIPARVLAELAGTADMSLVVVRNGVVLYAPGELDLGRSTRLANRAQRRALRGVYRNCAIPGCSVGYDRCELHHVIWWRLGGRTDLANLIPVCTKHHGKIHHDGWVIELGPHRELTLRLPDGTIHNTGPPHRNTAA